MPVGNKKPAKKKKKDPNRGLRSNRGYTKQEHASDNRKLARAMNPRAKKKKNETAKEKASRKSYNKARRKSVKASGRAATGNKKGSARRNLH